jgi:four helix bundle protein
VSRESTVVSFKKSYRDLKVWQKAIELTKVVYSITENFPKREHYGLASQMRRAAVSVASNIAEGASRHTDRDYAHFLVMARGSLAELTTQSIIACEVGFISVEIQKNLEIQADEVSRMLNGLKSKLTTHD